MEIDVTKLPRNSLHKDLENVKPVILSMLLGVTLEIFGGQKSTGKKSMAINFRINCNTHSATQTKPREFSILQLLRNNVYLVKKFR